MFTKSHFLVAFAAISILIVSCQQVNRNIIPVNASFHGKAAQAEAVAYFSEGCFWHTEIVFESLDGVRDAVSGYAGGADPDPDYEKVSTGNTGHAETVKVYYDPSKIDYATLLAAFFASHDPTTYNRQGNDEGSEYRSIAFYRNMDERAQILEAIKKINESGEFEKPVVTELQPFKVFYEAEQYHQDYIRKNPDDPYVRNVSIPDFVRFRNNFVQKPAVLVKK